MAEQDTTQKDGAPVVPAAKGASEAEVKKAEVKKAELEKKDAAKKEDAASKQRTKTDVARKKEEAKAAEKAEAEAPKAENLRRVGWEDYQAERENEVAVATKPKVEKFEGHKLEDRLEVAPESADE